MGRCQIALQGVGAPLDGCVWEFQGRAAIGRSQSSELYLDHSSISRQHAEVVPTPQGWMVRDLGSANGTFVNGIRVPQTSRRLQLKDCLQCGQLTLRITALAVEGPPPPPPKQDPSPIEMSSMDLAVQAVAKRSWEQGLQVLADHDDQRLQGKHFLTLLRAGYHLSYVTSLDGMLQSVLDDTVAVLNAQCGCFVLSDPATGELSLRAASPGHRPGSTAKHFSQTLARRCFDQGQSVLGHEGSGDRPLERSKSIELEGMGSIICALVRSPRKRLGVLHLYRGRLQERFTEEDFHLADAIAATVAVGVESALLVEAQRGLFLQDVAALAQRAVELHDPYSSGHSQRVTAYALLIAEELHLSAAECQQIRVGARLHDIGKLAIQEVILGKPDKLIAEDVEHVRTHTLKGAAMVEAIPDLVPVVPIVRNHHEHWDGSGYPDGLAGEDIPVLARVVAVADAFDTMTSDQPYRAALSQEQAFAELHAKAGSQFDPQCVEAFVRARPRVEAVGGSAGGLSSPLASLSHEAAYPRPGNAPAHGTPVSRR